MRNRQGLLLFVLWHRRGHHSISPTLGNTTPLVRGDLINCFSTLLLFWHKMPFFYFWQCPIFFIILPHLSSYLRLGLSIFRFLDIILYYFVFVVVFYCDFYLLLCVYYLACFRSFVERKIETFYGGMEWRAEAETGFVLIGCKCCPLGHSIGNFLSHSLLGIAF